MRNDIEDDAVKSVLYKALAKITKDKKSSFKLERIPSTLIITKKVFHLTRTVGKEKILWSFEAENYTELLGEMMKDLLHYYEIADQIFDKYR